MKKDYLKDEGNALRVQKHQLDNSENKLSEIDALLSQIENSQKEIAEDNSKYLSNEEYTTSSIDISDNEYEESYDEIDRELALLASIKKPEITQIQELDSIKFDENTTWDEYTDLVEDYGFKHNLNLKEDAFKHLMTKSQQVALQKRIKDDFTLKNADCDIYDYMIAGTCGSIGGLIDILFVGAPGDSKLGDIADKQANNITEKFAEFVGWDKDKAVKKGKDTTKSAIGYLEGKFKINYDQATTNGKNGTGGLVKNLSASNHHLKSLGHSPDLIGLFFSILNQFTSTSSFIDQGKIITIDTETFELQGDNFIAKIFCGFANWFGHLMSDWVGSSGASGRGSGVPIPFYNLFLRMNFGEFGQHKQTFATITTKVFESGYDARHAMAMAVPVLTTELLVRFMYTMKAHFYHQKDWRDSIPNGNIPELRRMLLVGHGALCLIDGVDAYIRSGGEMVTFLSRTNLLAWVRFGQLSLKELNAWYNAGHIDADSVDEYLDKEYKEMLKK